MTSLLQCEVCGTSITPGPLGNVCPVCLLREGHTDFLHQDPAGRPAIVSGFQDRGALPRAFGSYELLEEIAHGGMGIVYRARQLALNREVALKLLLAGSFASPEFVRRFQREAAAAASLRHPHIVGVYEVGEVDGQPFLAMEYVAGQTLAALVRERPLPPRDAARYLQLVSEAVQHAHEHGLLHRDLKPSNVLVDLDDQPRVTDFGLAKRMDGTTDLTVTGQMLGSPNYLSPEAALGHENQLTPASDVYSLGATLYHLLTGRPPLVAGSLAETLVQVREETAIAPRQLNPAVPLDLETICLKCLEKEPARRYASAQELADDLGRWLRGETIRARPATPLERAWKWSRRNPAQAALVGTVMLAVVAVVATSLWFNVRLTSARNDSEQNRRLSETNRIAAEASAVASRERLMRMQVVTGNRLVAEGDPLAAALWFADALRTGNATNARAELPNRRRLASAWAAAPRLVRVVRGSNWDRTPPFNRPAGPTNRPFLLERQANGEVKVIRRDGTAVIFEDGKGTEGDYLPAARDAVDITLNARGDHALVFAHDRSQRVWNLHTGRPLTDPLPSDAYQIAPRWNLDGQAWLRVREQSGRFYLELRRITAPAEPVVAWVDSHLFSSEFDPGGRWLATCHWDGGVRLWTADTLQSVGPIMRHANGIGVIAFSPDGSRLATGGWGEEVRVWSVPDGHLLTPPLQLSKQASYLAFSGDGRYLLTTVPSDVGLIWDLFVPEPVKLDGLTASTFLVNVNAAGFIAGWDETSRGHFWIPDPTAQNRLRHQAILEEVHAGLTAFTLSDDGQYAASGSMDGRLLLWEVKSGKLLHSVRRGTSFIIHTIFSPDGRQVATAATNGIVRRFRVPNAEELPPIEHHDGPVRRVAFSPDSKRIASAGADGTVKVWESETGKLLGELPCGYDVSRVTFSPDGTRILVSLADGTLAALYAQLWDARTFQPVGQRMQHDHGVAETKFFPDGARVVTASVESEARVWNAADGTPHTPWIRCGRRIIRTEVSPDGLTVMTIDESNTMRLWDADSGELLSASQPGEKVLWGAFVDAEHVVFGGPGTPLRIRTLPAASGSPTDLADLSRLTSGHELDGTGGLSLLSESVRLALFNRLREVDADRFMMRPFAPEWHRQELARAQGRGDAFAAKFHADALTADR